jgi:hypothetical protein
MMNLRRFSAVAIAAGAVWVTGGRTPVLGAATVPTQVMLFGKQYRVEVHSLAGTYKNNVTITQPGDYYDLNNNRKANLFFAPGDTRDNDELYVVAEINYSNDTDTADQFYRLTGTDASGIFSQQNSNASQFFGGNVGPDKGGRPSGVMLINRDNSGGLKSDRNLVLSTLSGNPSIRYYDLDTLGGSYTSSVVHTQTMNNVYAFAPGPNGTVVTIGRSAPFSPGVKLGVMDPQQNSAFAVETTVTDSLPKVNGSGLFPHSIAQYAGNEYWLLYTTPAPDGNGTDPDANLLVRFTVTFPLDLATAGRGSLGVKALGSEDLLLTGLAPGDIPIIQGITFGREVRPGQRIIYLTDWDGNLLTLTPLP